MVFRFRFPRIYARSGRGTILGPLLGAVLCFGGGTYFKLKDNFPDHLTVFSAQHTYELQDGTQIPFSLSMHTAMQNLQDEYNLFSNNPDILEQLILYIYNEETNRGKIRSFSDYLAGLVIDTTTTGAFELSIDNYAKDKGIDREHAFKSLQDFSVSLQAIVDKIHNDSTYLTSTGDNISQLTDKEKVFYFALSHNGGFTLNSGLKLQLVTRNLLDSSGLVSTPLALDGRIGPESQEAIGVLVEELFSQRHIVQSQRDAFLREITQLRNSEFHKFDNFAVTSFLLELYPTNNSFYLTESEIATLSNYNTSNPIKYAERAVNTIF